MTIHHDKLAYGKLKGLSDEMSADEIAKLVGELNEEDEDREDEASSQKAITPAKTRVKRSKN